MSDAVEKELQTRELISHQISTDFQASTAHTGAVPSNKVSQLVAKVPEVSMKALPDNWVEKIRKYIPAEVLVGWATTKQVLDFVFRGAVDTPGEITTFAVVWAGPLPYPLIMTSSENFRILQVVLLPLCVAYR